MDDGKPVVTATLRAFLEGPNPVERITAVVEFIKQCQRYATETHLELGGLYLDCADEELSAKLTAARFRAEEIVKWFAMHRASLEVTLAPPEKVENSAEPIPATFH